MLKILFFLCNFFFAQSYPKAPGGSVKVLSMNFVKCIHIKAHAQNSPGTNCNQLIIDTRFRDWTEVDVHRKDFSSETRAEGRSANPGVLVVILWA